MLLPSPPAPPTPHHLPSSGSPGRSAHQRYRRTWCTEVPSEQECDSRPKWTTCQGRGCPPELLLREGPPPGHRDRQPHLRPCFCWNSFRLLAWWVTFPPSGAGDDITVSAVVVVGLVALLGTPMGGAVVAAGAEARIRPGKLSDSPTTHQYLCGLISHQVYSGRTEGPGPGQHFQTGYWYSPQQF